MPNVVVVGGMLRCSHGGTLKLAQGDQRLAVQSGAALTAGMEVGLSFATGAPGVVIPCPLPVPLGPPGSSPCTATMKATAGVSEQVTVGGVGVLLEDAKGPAVNANDPAANWSVLLAGQTLLNVDH